MYHEHAKDGGLIQETLGAHAKESNKQNILEFYFMKFIITCYFKTYPVMIVVSYHLGNLIRLLYI